MTKPSRPGTAVHEKGQRRVEDILDAAVRVLIEDGYALFTMRRIADAADMRLSNLQYYFSTKEDLLNALLQRTVDIYDASLAALAQNRTGTPQMKFRRMIEYLLQDQTDKDSCIIFWELWAIAGRDAAVAAIMNAYYDSYLDKMSEAIRAAAPSMPKRLAQRNAGVIVALIEGASLLRGFGKPRRTSLAGYERAIIGLCEQLAADSLSDRPSNEPGTL